MYSQLRNLLAAKIDASPAQENKVINYFEMLTNKAAPLGMVGNADKETLFSRHIADSLYPLTFEDVRDALEQKKVIDLGSGAGLPGIPLAILMANTRFILLESNQKRVRFLREVVERLELQNVRVENTRVEKYKGDLADTVIYRAFMKPLVSLELALHVIKPGGKILYWRARDWEYDSSLKEKVMERLNDLGYTRLSHLKYEVENLEGERGIQIFERNAFSKRGFPRDWPRIKKERWIFEVT